MILMTWQRHCSTKAFCWPMDCTIHRGRWHFSTVSQQAAFKGESAGTAFALLSDFLTKPPSIGNWEDKLTSIKKDYSALLPPALSDVIGKVNEMKNKLQMSAYRNEYIGHGAYMATASQEITSPESVMFWTPPRGNDRKHTLATRCGDFLLECSAKCLRCH